MVLLIIITAAVQIIFNAGFQPLVAFLPLSMGGKIAEISGDTAALELHGLAEVSTSDKGSPETVNEEGGEHIHDILKVTHTDLLKVFPPRSRSRNDDGKLLDRNSGRTATPDGDEVLNVHAFDHPSTYVVSTIHFAEMTVLTLATFVGPQTYLDASG